MRADAAAENIGTFDPLVHSYRTGALKHGPVREPVSVVNGGGADKATSIDTVAAASTPAAGEMKSDVSQIHHYAQAGDVEEVRRCLLAGLNEVDEVDELGCTAVHLAGAMGYADVVKLLVEEHGALVDARDGALCTALHAASEGGHPVVVELLLRLGAEIDARNGKEQTPLHYACGYGQVEAAQQLTLRGASTGARDIQGNTPLHLGCCGGGNDVVRLLVNNGSPLQALNNRGRRPLHLACRSGHLDIAITLLENGADPSARDANGMQAIDMIGAKRRIPQGIRFDLINTLERYQLGEFALARPPSSSAGSLRQMWKDREDATRLSGASSEGLGSRSSSLAKGASSQEGLSTCSSAGGGRGGGSFGGVGAPMQPPRERGMDAEAGRSPRWALGAAVAGRLEEMRARELGASLRAKVQENEAMKRYLDSVKEEMRILQQKVSEQSSARFPPDAGDGSSFGVRGSIAEQVAHTMYGSEGIGGLSPQDMAEAGAEADVALAAMGKGLITDTIGVGKGITAGVSTGGVPAPAMAAPFHAGTEDVTDSSVVVDGRPSSEETFASDGGSCIEQPAGFGSSPVSMSQLLMAKRAQLQSLLGVPHQPGQV